MMNIGGGKRDGWVFEYTASKLAEGAQRQKQFRLDRVEKWKEGKAKVMSEIRESGVEIAESMAAEFSNYTTKMVAPQVSIKADLQSKLAECHKKIQEHQQAADEYEGWIQVLTANPEARLKLTQADWLYFFGKV